MEKAWLFGLNVPPTQMVLSVNCNVNHIELLKLLCNMLFIREKELQLFFMDYVKNKNVVRQTICISSSLYTHG